MAPPDGHERTAPAHRRGMLARVRSHVRPGSFPTLLAASLVLYLLHAAAVESETTEILTALGRLSVLAACLYVLSADRLTLLLGAAVALLMAGFEFHVWPGGPWIGRILDDLLSCSFQIWVFVVVLREVFRRETSELDAVIGALGAFLLLMMMFMRVHALIEVLSPGSYVTQGPPLGLRSQAELRSTFQYFSTITLTTVGYGDIVPVSPTARLAAAFEAIVGQLYLAVVVATLVGRVAARRD